MKAKDIEPGTRIVVTDDTVVTVTESGPARKDPLYEFAGGWANAWVILWRGGYSIVLKDDDIVVADSD